MSAYRMDPMVEMRKEACKRLLNAAVSNLEGQKVSAELGRFIIRLFWSVTDSIDGENFHIYWPPDEGDEI